MEDKYVVVSPELKSFFFDEFSPSEEEIMTIGQAKNLVNSLGLKTGEYEIYKLVKVQL